MMQTGIAVLPTTGKVTSKVRRDDFEHILPPFLSLDWKAQLNPETSGSAWEYDEATDEYYLRLFCREQPDLNWENPDVRKAAHDIMRFWLDRGVDGFRIDVINFISKDQSFPDSNQRFLRGTEYYACGPRCHEYLKDLGAILKEYDAFSVGEMPCVHDERELLKAVAADREELSMIFHFELYVAPSAPSLHSPHPKKTLSRMQSNPLTPLSPSISFLTVLKQHGYRSRSRRKILAQDLVVIRAQNNSQQVATLHVRQQRLECTVPGEPRPTPRRESIYPR